MQRWIACLACAAALVTCVCLTLASGSPSTVLRGVAPAFAHLFSGSEFICRDGSKRIPIAQVNDDYCDCADGSDEPGHFYCANAGYKPQQLASMFVNDGVCDCCDGSDEWSGRIQCPDTCHEVGRTWRAEQERLQRERAQGLAARSELVAAAAAGLEQLRQTLADQRARLDDARARADVRRSERDAAEAVESAERARLEAEQAARKERLRALEADAAAASVAPAGAEDAGVAASTAPGDAAPGDAAPAEDGPRLQDTEAYRTRAPGGGPVRALLTAGGAGRGCGAEAAERAREALREAERQVSELETAVREAEQRLGRDYGPQQALFALDGRCVTVPVREYEYEVCVMGEARQKQGHSSTLLGRFTRWEGGHTVMVYEGGLRCWGGPDRSARVHLECGAETRLLSAEEPAKCEYVMRMATPAACQPVDAHEHAYGAGTATSVLE